MDDKRSMIEKKRSRIIEETDKYLELIYSSMYDYRDEIRQLTDFNVNFNGLIALNNVESDNIIYAYDNNISIKMMWNAIEDLTSVFRLQKMLEKHLLGKNVRIEGGEFLFADQSSKRLSLNQLSSGEKQLILLYWKILDGMDRKVMQNIVLIDEPELSLHINWQRDFIENLEELLVNQSRYGDEADGAYNVKIIIATHSPSILTNHIDKTYELGLSDGV
jgi:predicted ATP-dependent endonuclease of OLD family